MNVTVRFADPTDAGALSRLTANAFSELSFTWTGEDTKGWLLAESEGYPLGTMQMLLGRPIGRLEMLSIDQQLRPKDRHSVITALANTGVSVLSSTGSQFIVANVEDSNKGFRRFLKRAYGFKATHRVNLYALDIRD